MEQSYGEKKIKTGVGAFLVEIFRFMTGGGIVHFISIYVFWHIVALVTPFILVIDAISPVGVVSSSLKLLRVKGLSEAINGGSIQEKYHRGIGLWAILLFMFSLVLITAYSAIISLSNVYSVQFIGSIIGFELSCLICGFLTMAYTSD